MSYLGNTSPPFYTNWGYAGATTPGILNPSANPQTIGGNKAWVNQVADKGTLATWTPAAYLALTASTENTDINFNLARTVQFATGAIALQRAVRFQPPTYDAVGASVISDAVNVSVGGPPVATGNMTFTRSWAQVWGTPVATAASIPNTSVSLGVFATSTGVAQLITRNAATECAVQTGSSQAWIGTTTAHVLNIQTNNANRAIFTSLGKLNLTPGASNSGSGSELTLTTPANTNMTTATEVPVVQFLTAVRKWADGTIGMQRDYLFSAMTLTPQTSTLTVTTAATVAISGAPIAGSGTTLTAAYSLWCQAGKAQFDGGAAFGLRADLKSYTVGTLPAAGVAGGMVYVSDAAVAACVAFSNGSNWKRCDNAATTVV